MVCLPLVERVESGTFSGLSTHILGEVGRNNPSERKTKPRKPRNHTCMGGGVGYGPFTSWDLTLQYESGVWKITLSPTQMHSRTSEFPAHGCMVFSHFLFVSKTALLGIAWKVPVFLPAHLGPPTQAWSLPQYLYSTPRETCAVPLGAKGSGIWSREGSKN